MHLLDLLGLFYEQYNRFPNPFKYLMLEKGTSFGQSPPPPKGVPPLPKIQYEECQRAFVYWIEIRYKF